MRHPRAVLSLILCGIWSVPAAAQYELGGGDVLDANTGTAYGKSNLPAGIQDYRNRNLLITGNVVGGRGFRGTVGYGAEHDFRGDLGSDDLFGERANAAFSSPMLLSAGRTLERLRFGQYLGAVEYRRAGRGASLQTLGEQRFTPQPMIDDRINLDHFAISSTTSAAYESRRDGRIVGLLSDAEGERRIVANASSLFGVQLIPMENYGQLIGLTSYDMARAAQDAEAGLASTRVGAAFDLGFADLHVADQRVDAEPLSTRVETESAQEQAEPLAEPTYREILERIAERYAAAEPEPPEESEPGGLLPLDEQFAQLREMLTDADPTGTGEVGTDEDDTADADPAAGPPTPSLDLERLAGPLRHGMQLEQLSAGDQTRFQELMATAEERLRDGEYFWAERRFERALRFTPGHPLATAGKGHAQIGAGLYAPAALTLRRLLMQRPEMIDVRYEPQLLPNRVRIATAIDELRQRMTEQRDRALHAFLLAYLGHQLDQPDLVREGLTVMGEAAPDDQLHALLEVVWLD